MKKRSVLWSVVLSLVLMGALVSCSSGTQAELESVKNKLEDREAVIESLEKLNNDLSEADLRASQLEAEIGGLEADLAAMEQLKNDNNDLSKDLEAKIEELAGLKAEYEEYREEMKPFEDMSAAEAEAERVKAEAEKARLEEEARAKEEAAKQAEAEVEASRKLEAEAKAKRGYETGITFDQLARTPDDYELEKVKFTGQVVQVIEGDETVNIRFAINGDYNQVVFCEYDKSIVSQRVLEDDRLTIYGISAGLYSYESTMGGVITIPAIYIEKIEFQ